MSGKGHRHVGGVKGTKFARTICPVCGRDTAGGNVNRERTRIALKPHKHGAALAREWCPGGGQIVTWR